MVSLYSSKHDSVSEKAQFLQGVLALFIVASSLGNYYPLVWHLPRKKASHNINLLGLRISWLNTETWLNPLIVEICQYLLDFKLSVMVTYL